MLMSTRPELGAPPACGGFSSSNFAAFATMRAPVAANGWAAASDEPLTFSFDRSIDVHVSRLRAKLGDDSRGPKILKTVRGVGYLLAGGDE